MNEINLKILSKLCNFKVVTMPDFFIDRTVKLPSFENILKEISIKLENGGGSIRNLNQIEVKGGNSVNTAYGLAKMGINVDLIIVADIFSQGYLKNVFSNYSNIKLNIIKGKPGFTVALEFPFKNRISNVMLSDVGDVSNFGPEMLTAKCWNKIDNADMVAIFNWSSNNKGTELSKEVFTRASMKNIMTYFAPADINERRLEVPGLLNKIESKLKILSLNENESRILSKILINEQFPTKYSYQDIIKAAKNLNKKIGINIDIHTPYGSASAENGETFFSNSYKIKQNFSTGAGDVWDSMNISGYLLNLKPEIRLKLANAAAAIYVSSLNMEPPTIKQLISFIKKNQ